MKWEFYVKVVRIAEARTGDRIRKLLPELPEYFQIRRVLADVNRE